MPKFWDRLLGRPTMELFAEQVKAMFQQRGVGPLTFDPERRELRSTGDRPTIHYLGNVHSDYQRAPKADRAAVIHRFVEGMVAAKNEFPADYASARPRLMPIVRS